MSVEHFTALSAELTGFTEEELRATDLADTYRSVVLEQAGPECLDQLAAAVDGDQPLRLDDERTRELARAVVQLWYLGTWPGLATPADPEPPAGQPLDRPFVVSARAYAQGLVWRTFGGHAPGTVPQGYGSWAAAPPGDDPGGGADDAHPAVLR